MSAALPNQATVPGLILAQAGRQGGLHVLGLRAHGPGPPRLVVAGPDGGVGALDLRGAFAWSVPEGRTCVGRAEDGVHVPCPAQRPVGPEGVCLPCSGIEDAACVFEPRCAREPAGCHCLATFGAVEHVVYLAFYGTLPKVGMTQAPRLARRLREQGADAGFVVSRHLLRAGAREAERALSFLHRVPEHRSHRETLPQLARPVPWDLVEARMASWAARLGVAHPQTVRIEHPMRQPAGGTPRRVYVRERLAGTWLGVKGPHLVFREREGRGHLPGPAPLAALAWRDLVGRRIRPGDVVGEGASDP